jgi:hypothetical protein
MNRGHCDLNRKNQNIWFDFESKEDAMGSTRTQIILHVVCWVNDIQGHFCSCHFGIRIGLQWFTCCYYTILVPTKIEKDIRMRDHVSWWSSCFPGNIDFPHLFLNLKNHEWYEDERQNSNDLNLHGNQATWITRTSSCSYPHFVLDTLTIPISSDFIFLYKLKRKWVGGLK